MKKPLGRTVNITALVVPRIAWLLESQGVEGTRTRGGA